MNNLWFTREPVLLQHENQINDLPACNQPSMKVI